jgi:hypothetical protein
MLHRGFVMKLQKSLLPILVLLIAGCTEKASSIQAGVDPATASNATAADVIDSAETQVAIACPSQDLKAFVAAFAEDPALQKAFTADPVDTAFVDMSAQPEPTESVEAMPREKLRFPVMPNRVQQQKEGLKYREVANEGGQAIVVLEIPDTDAQVLYTFRRDACWTLVKIVDPAFGVNVEDITVRGLQAKDKMSAVHNLLTVFSSSQNKSWNDFESVQNVTWLDSKPIPVPLPSPDKPNLMSRSGEFEWSSNDALASNTKAVEQATLSKVSSKGAITIFGDKQAINKIALQKLGPSIDYETFIQSQLGAAAKLKVIANKCANDLRSADKKIITNSFYLVELGQDKPIYLEAYADNDGGTSGPGYTNYHFYRVEPIDRIDGMRCVKLQ